MTEIFNLRTLCRCCHTDGSFKDLKLSYLSDHRLEIYATMLQETLNITIKTPPFEASCMICETCIGKLREASKFKQQVLECEKKFEEYCKNEQLFMVKEEFDRKSNSDGGSDREDINIGLEVDDVKYYKDAVKVSHCSEETKFNDDGYLKDKNYVKNENNVSEAEQPTNNLTTIPIECNFTDKTKTTVRKLEAKDKPKQQKQLRLDSNYEARVETEEGHRYACKLCDKKFKLLKLLRKHIAIQHKECYKCKICSYQCTGRLHYQRHGKTHYSDDLKCHFCGKLFKTKYSLYQHVNIHTKEEEFQCDKCFKYFAYKQTLRKHLLWHDGANKTCMCDVCGRGFNDKANLRAHIQVVHEKQRPFKCTQCPKTFTAKKHLKLHVLVHSGEKPFKCEMCYDQFVTPWRLKRHHFKHHSDSIAPGVRMRSYTCRVCKIKCESRGKLMQHLKTHIGQKNYKCHLCPKDFTCKYSFNRHVIGHSGEKPYKCDMCCKKYTQQSQLSRHKKIIHDPNSENYRLTERLKCDICNKSFRDIKKHMKSHSIRPHVCEICSKSYPERNTLNRHISYVHHGMKPHPCTLCEKKYAKWTGLQKHMKRIHKQEIKKEVQVEESQ